MTAIWSVANPKGGNGKSTLSENLATVAAYRGFKVAIYDQDIQGSSGNYCMRRDAYIAQQELAGDDPVPQIRYIVRNKDEKDPRRTIKGIMDAFDLIIIDNQGGGDDEGKDFTMQCAITISDLVLVPCSTSTKDYEQLPRFLNSIEKVNESIRLQDMDFQGVDVRFVLNRFKKVRKAMNASFKENLIQNFLQYMSLSSVEIPDRSNLETTGQGLCAVDYNLPERAFFEQLFDECTGTVKVQAERKIGAYNE